MEKLKKSQEKHPSARLMLHRFPTRGHFATLLLQLGLKQQEHNRSKHSQTQSKWVIKKIINQDNILAKSFQVSCVWEKENKYKTNISLKDHILVRL